MVVYRITSLTNDQLLLRLVSNGEGKIVTLHKKGKSVITESIDDQMEHYKNIGCICINEVIKPDPPKPKEPEQLVLQEPETPKRRRRTNAEIAADNAKVAEEAEVESNKEEN